MITLEKVKTMTQKDAMIRENLEKQAVKYAYKNLLDRINKEIVKSVRQFGKTTKVHLVLGRNLFNLLLEAATRGMTVDLLDGESLVFSSGNIFDRDAEMTLWGIPIYVIMDDDYLGIAASGNAIGDSITVTNDWGEFKADMDKLIKDLPKGAELKGI